MGESYNTCTPNPPPSPVLVDDFEYLGDFNCMTAAEHKKLMEQEAAAEDEKLMEQAIQETVAKFNAEYAIKDELKDEFEYADPEPVISKHPRLSNSSSSSPGSTKSDARESVGYIQPWQDVPDSPMREEQGCEESQVEERKKEEPKKEVPPPPPYTCPDSSSKKEAPPIRDIAVCSSYMPESPPPYTPPKSSSAGTKRKLDSD